MLHAAFCVRQVKLLLRTCNAHIAKSAFLLNFLFAAIHHRTEAGENSLLHTDDENIGEFQTLRAVQCHEGNGFLSLLIAVNIRNESNLLQKAFQLAFGVSFIIFRRFIHKFINILDTVQRVIRPLCHQQLQIARPFHNGINQFGNGKSIRIGAQLFKQAIEILEFCYPCFQRSDFIQTAQCAVKRKPVFLRKSSQLIQRGFANAALRYIDDSSESNRIRRVRKHL